MLLERGIAQEWVEIAVTSPEWTEPDTHAGRSRAFRAIPEAGGKILRVVYSEANGEFRVITVFFDRNAKKH